MRCWHLPAVPCARLTPRTLPPTRLTRRRQLGCRVRAGGGQPARVRRALVLLQVGRAAHNRSLVCSFQQPQPLPQRSPLPCLSRAAAWARPSARPACLATKTTRRSGPPSRMCGSRPAAPGASSRRPAGCATPLGQRCGVAGCERRKARRRGDACVQGGQEALGPLHGCPPQPNRPRPTISCFLLPQTTVGQPALLLQRRHDGAAACAPAAGGQRGALQAACRAVLACAAAATALRALTRHSTRPCCRVRTAGACLPHKLCSQPSRLCTGLHRPLLCRRLGHQPAALRECRSLPCALRLACLCSFWAAGAACNESTPPPLRLPSPQAHHAAASCEDLPARCDWSDFSKPQPNSQARPAACLACLTTHTCCRRRRWGGTRRWQVQRCPTDAQPTPNRRRPANGCRCSRERWWRAPLAPGTTPTMTSETTT